MKKMDEMETALSLKAIKISWFYTILFLFIWIITDYIKDESFNLIAFILLISQNIIRISIEQYLKRTMIKGEK
ncbi:MAG: hypothetical protein ACOX3U_02265 [Christensenellales bacterium]|jgi:hypothetical protein